MTFLRLKYIYIVKNSENSKSGARYLKKSLNNRVKGNYLFVSKIGNVQITI